MMISYGGVVSSSVHPHDGVSVVKPLLTHGETNQEWMITNSSSPYHYYQIGTALVSFPSSPQHHKFLPYKVRHFVPTHMA